MRFHLIHLANIPIFEQLVLEEFLLRESKENFCIFNHGSPPAVVMGISGRLEELVDAQKTTQLHIPIIKRFSGGGTVVVDEHTLFLSFICNKADFDFQAYPERILQWSEELLKKALLLPTFALKQNDFVLGNQKCGGNAQYITKERFLQHTSFLWDFCPDKMSCLLYPKKTPLYREGRAHTSFLCPLKTHLPTKETLFERVHRYLETTHTLEILPYTQPTGIKNSRISTVYHQF